MSDQDLQVVHAGDRLAIPGILTPTSWTPPGNLPYERWELVIETLRHMEKGVQWWIGDGLRWGEHEYGQMYSQAMDTTSLDYQTLANDKWVADKVDTSLRRENLSWSHHKEVAALDYDTQRALLDRAESGNWSVRDLRSEVREIKQEINRDRRLETVALNSLGKYAVLYADPPWEYQFTETDNRAIENHYPTMTLAEICELPVPDITHDHAVLFLWATSPKLAEAMQVLAAWDFDYRTSIVWVKDKIGMGYYVRGQHEMLLIARRGDLPVPAPEDRPPSVVHAPRTTHSTKPPELYEVIEAMYPNLPRIELFSRTYRPGWDAWGLEARHDNAA